VKDITINNR